MITEVIGGFVLFLLMLEIVSRVKSQTKLLPPGPTKWPVIGNVIEIASVDRNYPHLGMEKLSKKYGEIISLRLGVHNAVLISSYHAMKEILTKDETIGRYSFPFVEDRSINKSFGIVWGNGTTWRDLRRYTMTTLRDFGYGKKKSMELAIQQEIEHMINFVKRKSSQNQGIFDVDAQDLAANAMNILWTFVGGYRFSEDDPDFKKMISHNEKQMGMARADNIYTTFPYLRHWFPRWTKHENHLEAHKSAKEFLRDIIGRVKDKKALRGGNPESFIEAFLDKVETFKDVENNAVFKEDQLIMVLMDLFLAGSDSTSTIMSWSVLLVVLNPHVQKKIQDEISRIVQPGEEISFDHISRMVYTKATIYEILRFSNMAPIPAARKAVNDITYKGYTIPKGILVMWNVTPVFNDESFWKDPQVFRPERFLNENGTELLKMYTERVAIFGFGKRICFGENLVWESTMMYLTNLLRTFTLTAVPGREPSAEFPISKLTLTPRPYCVKVQSRI